jgi:hypothetical protein
MWCHTYVLALRAAGKLLHIDDRPFMSAFADFVLFIKGFDAEPIALARAADIDDFGKDRFGPHPLANGRSPEVADVDFGPNRLFSTLKVRR